MPKHTVKTALILWFRMWAFPPGPPSLQRLRSKQYPGLCKLGKMQSSVNQELWGAGRAWRLRGRAVVFTPLREEFVVQETQVWLYSAVCESTQEGGRKLTMKESRAGTCLHSKRPWLEQGLQREENESKPLWRQLTTIQRNNSFRFKQFY